MFGRGAGTAAAAPLAPATARMSRYGVEGPLRPFLAPVGCDYGFDQRRARVWGAPRRSDIRGGGDTDQLVRVPQRPRKPAFQSGEKWKIGPTLGNGSDPAKKTPAARQTTLFEGAPTA